MSETTALQHLNLWNVNTNTVDTNIQFKCQTMICQVFCLQVSESDKYTYIRTATY